MSWLQSGFISTQLWAAAVCDVPGGAHWLLLSASLHQKPFYKTKMYPNCLCTLCWHGAESPCPGLSHPLRIPGYRRRFWTCWVLKSPFPMDSLSSPIPARAELEDGKCSDEHISHSSSAFADGPRIVLIFGIWLVVCWGKIEVCGLVFSPYLKKTPWAPQCFCWKKLYTYNFPFMKSAGIGSLYKNAGRWLSIVMLYKPGFCEV